MGSSNLPLTDEELLFEKLEAVTIQGADKRGRKIVRIVGKFFPGDSSSCLISSDLSISC